MSQLSLSFKDRIISVHQLNQANDLIIGHTPDCDFVIDSLAVSPKHAKITFSDRVYSIETIDSEAIVLINNQNIDTKTPLSDGDDITIGKHNLLFNFDERNKAAPDRKPEEPAVTKQLNGWLQYLNGSEMGKTKQIRQKMRNIHDEQEDNIALISKRNDGFYISFLKGDEPLRVNSVSIGETSLKLETNSKISIGSQEILFFID
ncbi:MAG: FHA domain-containing protein [gamma proteobacterium symbiont of Taylorina sp.]|nr:FHA domain-containing protein [gamma proteobacterium symbiont of Taylorina sp.]